MAAHRSNRHHGGGDFINNYFSANQSGYGLTDKDLPVVLILQHRASLASS